MGLIVDYVRLVPTFSRGFLSAIYSISMRHGRALELFYVDGTPEGIVIGKIMNWTGHVLLTPRVRLIETLNREEVKSPGVYILIGPAAEDGLPRAYIGQSENVAERIRNHDQKLDWWDQVVLITAGSARLNRADIAYIEARMVEEAKQASVWALQNGNSPSLPTLSEAAISNMEQFLEYALSVLPALRVDGFMVRTRQPAIDIQDIQSTAKQPAFWLKVGENNEYGPVGGNAVLEDGEFIVQPGSFGRANWIGVEHHYKKLFNQVVETGVYPLEGSRRVFRQAYAFQSPSAAGAVLTGRATAGPKAWVMANDPQKTYQQWEAEQLERQL